MKSKGHAYVTSILSLKNLAIEALRIKLMGNSFRIRCLRHFFTEDEDQKFGRKSALTLSLTENLDIFIFVILRTAV